MSVNEQLYQLQEVDLEFESNELTLKQVASQLGASQRVSRAKAKLASENQCLEELRRQQHSTEWEIDDLTNKLTIAEKKLYSGEVNNPKELLNLQQDVNGLKANRSKLEDKVLEIMEHGELAETSIATMGDKLKTLEYEWSSQQRQLSTQVEQLETILSNLEHNRQLLRAKIDPKALEYYDGLKKQKRTAVARVEQGICRSCRISLPTAELQQARSGNLVQCSSCGRILFLA